MTCDTIFVYSFILGTIFGMGFFAFMLWLESS
jgi:hypothetical protein